MNLADPPRHDYLRYLGQPLKEFKEAETLRALAVDVAKKNAVLSAFAVKVIAHLCAQGPTPEKTAEYFQLVAEARRLQQALKP